MAGCRPVEARDHLPLVVGAADGDHHVCVCRVEVVTKVKGEKWEADAAPATAVEPWPMAMPSPSVHLAARSPVHHWAQKWAEADPPSSRISAPPRRSRFFDDEQRTSDRGSWIFPKSKSASPRVGPASPQDKVRSVVSRHSVVGGPWAGSQVFVDIYGVRENLDLSWNTFK